MNAIKDLRTYLNTCDSLDDLNAEQLIKEWSKATNLMLGAKNEIEELWNSIVLRIELINKKTQEKTNG